MAPQTDAATVKLLSDLRLQRGTIKGQQRKLKNHIEKCGEKSSESELQTRLGLLEGYLSNFNIIQTKLDCMDEEEAKGDEREAFEETYCVVKSKILTYLARNKIRGSITLAGDQSFSGVHRSAHLPKLVLSKFSGKYSEWQDFYSMFKTLVHEDEFLSNVEKFQHLRSCLTDSALRAIQALELTSDNYDIALTLLKKRFDNKRLIFQAHIEEFFNLPAVEKGSVIQLRNLSDAAGVHMRALLSMATKEQVADGLLTHIITHKFDSQTQMKWEDEAQLNVIPSWDELSTFIQRRCQTMENVAHIQGNTTHVNKTASTSQALSRKSNLSRKAALITSSNTNSCLLCKDTNHAISSCSKFIALNPVTRYHEAKRLNLCINCLRSGHNVKTCKSGRCRFCHSRHHSLLHMSSSEEPPKQAVTSLASITAASDVTSQHNVQHSTTQASLNACSPAGNSNHSAQVFLATALVLIQDSSGSFVPCRALLDSASQLNFITERLRQQLQLKRVRADTPISGIGSSNISVKFKSHVILKSRFNEFSTNIDALILPNITVNQPEKFVNISDWEIPSNLNLADSYFNKPHKVDMLIGAGLFFDLLCVGQIKLGDNLPTLQKTLFGWIVSGPCKSNSIQPMCHLATSNMNHFEPHSSIDNILRKFWEIEHQEPCKNQFTAEEIACEEHFIKNYSRSSSGRYSVRLPFRENPMILGDSLDVAKRRFFRLESKLTRTPELKLQYTSFMTEYIDLNHMAQIELENLSRNRYFLPHHAVLKPDSSTTKLRVVFDGSCKTTSGRSLNDILMIGPVIQDDLFTILLRFRTYRYAITADVSKMYRQVQVKEPDNDLQCILWRESVEKPLQIYRLQTVTYGTSSASFLSTRCLAQLAQDEASDFPIGSKVVSRDFYVDDLLTGAHILDDAIKIRYEVDHLLQRGKFILRKWCSNSNILMQSFSDCDKEKLIQVSGSNVMKTLGMIWAPNQDEFRYTSPNSSSTNSVTKRSVLSSIASLFDPLGLINPIIVKAKIFMQQLWRLKLNWDESLPLELHTKWLDFVAQLHLIKDISIPRHTIGHYEHMELHGFADASSVAYGACIYLRTFNDEEIVSSRLLCAKSRVAPVKTVSIPRLELCAALLLAELMHRIHSALNVSIENVFCWSDSTIVLSWITSSPCEWNSFIANRITKIQNLTASYHWRHVPTLVNPADLISRGLFPQGLLQSTLWFNGPGFLREPQTYWPNFPSILNLDMPEKRKTKLVLLSTKTVDLVTSCKFHNSYTKLQRVFAYVRRFCYNSRHTARRLTGPFTKEELDSSLICIISIIQKSEFPEDHKQLSKGEHLNKNSRLKSLYPFLGPDNILRVGGRLQNSGLHFDSMHPIILPRSHVFTKTLMTYYHHKHLHANPRTLLSIIRTKFWPIGGSCTAKAIQHNCIRCFRTRPKGIEQIMGALPAERVQPSRPFSCSGVDFFGPLYITTLIRGRPPTKTYGCIFICFSTKAVHIELVSNLTTDAFLGALKRFVARRGKVSTIFSDNATNFVGARKELEDLRILFQSENHIHTLEQACQEEGISWKFIPPRSPHFGGLWESSVKTAKHYIRRVIGQSLLTQEELNTLLCQIEAVINSRPLIPLSNDPNDLHVLTPGHFLIGSSLLSIPEPNISDLNINLLTRWQRVRTLHQRFWNLWSMDYLQSLQQRAKWTHPYPNVSTGTLVLIREDNIPPLKWNIGRVINVHPGADGAIRVVSIKTSSGIIKRAITRVCPLPIESCVDERELEAEPPKAAGML